MPVYNANSEFDRSFEVMDPKNFHYSELQNHSKLHLIQDI
jgi:hypothetical protein